MQRTGSEALPRRAMVWGLLGFLLVACDVPAPRVADPGTATGMPEPVTSSVPAGRAVVFLMRGREFASSANSYRVFVNGTPVADLDIGMRHRQVVAPGAVELRAEVVPTIVNFGVGLAMMEKPVLSITARAGETHVIELDPAFAGGPVFRQRDQAALREAVGYIDAPLPAR